MGCTSCCLLHLLHLFSGEFRPFLEYSTEKRRRLIPKKGDLQTSSSSVTATATPRIAAPHPYHNRAFPVSPRPPGSLVAQQSAGGRVHIIPLNHRSPHFFLTNFRPDCVRELDTVTTAGTVLIYSVTDSRSASRRWHSASQPRLHAAWHHIRLRCNHPPLRTAPLHPSNKRTTPENGCSSRRLRPPRQPTPTQTPRSGPRGQLACPA